MSAELDHQFKSHLCSPDRVEAMTSVRRVCKDAAELVQTLVPKSREQSLALTKLEEAMFWANAGIAREVVE